MKNEEKKETNFMVEVVNPEDYTYDDDVKKALFLLIAKNLEEEGINYEKTVK